MEDVAEFEVACANVNGLELQLVDLALCRAPTKPIGSRGTLTVCQYHLLARELRISALHDKVRRR